MSYQENLTQTNQLIRSYNGTWDGIDAEAVARMRLQNRFRTGLDIARYTAAMMPILPTTPSRWVAGTVSSASRR